MTRNCELDLQEVDPNRRDAARAAFDAGSASDFLGCTENHKGLWLVFHNQIPLRKKGIYEEALLQAFTSTRTNHVGMQASVLEQLFELAHKDRLRAAGDVLPEGEQFIVYRGVAGVGRQRRVKGPSWTLDFPRACWFAVRLSLPGPAVHKTTVSRNSVLAFFNERNEQEVLFWASSTQRLRMSMQEIAAEAYAAGFLGTLPNKLST